MKSAGIVLRMVCLPAGGSEETIQKSIAAFHNDPEWQRVEQETEKHGKLRNHAEPFKLTPADSSALK